MGEVAGDQAGVLHQHEDRVGNLLQLAVGQVCAREEMSLEEVCVCKDLLRRECDE